MILKLRFLAFDRAHGRAVVRTRIERRVEINQIDAVGIHAAHDLQVVARVDCAVGEVRPPPSLKISPLPYFLSPWLQNHPCALFHTITSMNPIVKSNVALSRIPLPFPFP